MKPRRTVTVAAVLGLLGVSTHRSADIPRSTDCEPDDVAAVADSVAGALATSRFVFLGSTHGGEKIHRFLLCLISRTAFQEIATEIIVEWANPIHQRLLDRYLVELDDISVEALRPAAFDTWAPDLWATLPQLPEFYEAVRRANTGKPLTRRIRVLAGNSPVDWRSVESAEDQARYPPKTNYTAHVIRDHLWPDTARRALVVYGIGHSHRSGGGMMADLLATIPQSQLFVLGTITWLRPAERAVVATLGDPDAPFFARAPGAGALSPVPYDLFYAREGPLGQYVDAVTYLGVAPDRNLAGTIELSAAEQAERSRRGAFVRDPNWFEYLARHRAHWFAGHPLDRAPDPRR